MPTRVLIEEAASPHDSGGETAPAADVAGLMEQLITTQKTHDDSTWSSTNLEAMLNELRPNTQAPNHHTQVNPKSRDGSFVADGDDNSVATAEHQAAPSPPQLNGDIANDSVTMTESQVVMAFSDKNERDAELSSICGDIGMDTSRCLLTPAQNSVFGSDTKIPKHGNSSFLDGNSLSLSPIPKLTATMIVPNRVKGPNQERFEQEFRLVQQKIREHQTQQESSYRELSLAEQQRKQNQVVRLLQRLGISKPDSETKAAQGVAEPADILSTSSILFSDNENDDESAASETLLLSCDEPLDHSMESNSTLNSPSAAGKTKSNENQEHSTSNSVDSIEIPRALQQSVETPHLAPKTDNSRNSESSEQNSEWARKRMATTSGKRGLDSSRRRTGVADDNSLVDSVRRLSLAHDSTHNTPSTPNDPTCSFTEDDDMLCGPDSSDVCLSSDESIHSEKGSASTDCEPQDKELDTICEFSQDSISCRRVHWGTDAKRKPFSKVSDNIEPENGHSKKPSWNPLTMERRVAKNVPATQTFPDPFEGLGRSVRRRMKRLYKWIQPRDSDNESPPPSMILALPDSLIQLLVLRLLCEDPPNVYTPMDSTYQKNSANANTLVVTRDKESLISWGHLFREGSSFAVMNYSTLPQARRNRHILEDLYRHDVVLTTFDSLKAHETVVSLNDKGWVSIDPSSFSETPSTGGSWLTSRSQRSDEESFQRQTNKYMSILHLAHWRRVIFVDLMGRKSYLVKPSTSRTVAARALNASSRIAFFQGHEDMDAGPSLSIHLKGDKRAAQSLGQVLRIVDTQLEQEVIFGGSVVEYDNSNVPTKDTRLPI